MITLETGVPGAGKTLYCVDKLLPVFIGATLKHTTDDGEIVEYKRRVFTNINGLLLDHEKIGPGAEWVQVADPENKGAKIWTQDKNGNKLGLNNWHEWAKPGDVIVYDEIQKPWPIMAAGSPVPPCITALETHRHMGVDFVVLTQHPMLINQNLMRLVGRHLHVRRVGNIGYAMVYEWDTASRTLLYKNAMAKKPYRYSKATFEKYKSAEVHTKSPRSLPTLIFGVLFAVGLIAYFAPAATMRLSERINPKPAVAESGKPIKHDVNSKDPVERAFAEQANAVKAREADAAKLLPASAAAAPAAPDPKDELTGCAKMAAWCYCYASTGKRLKVEAAACEAELAPIVARAPAKLPADWSAPAVAADDRVRALGVDFGSVRTRTASVF